ncbi:MAG: 4-oxalocrotonate tautomerase family protein [Deltaproteobacteria bacterium]|nr:4-oxalocrotonate tautomerase family protein [Deltaproteobacteria bacterium]MBW2307374.1 4-oxalocrotonate tautomerase family protein [Deltaproteobacteria bacterium]
MPLVHIVMAEGRSKEQKAKLARRLTDDMVDILGISEEAVHIAFHELPRENFTWRGLLLTEKPK